jgi:hypothetical protein
MGNAIKFLLNLKFVPSGWLSVCGGFGTLLIGAGNLLCGYTGLCETTVSTEVALGMVTLGGGLVGLGRRKG